MAVCDSKISKGKESDRNRVKVSASGQLCCQHADMEVENRKAWPHLGSDASVEKSEPVARSITLGRLAS